MTDNTVTEDCLLQVAGAAPMVRQYVVNVLLRGRKNPSYHRVRQLLSEFEDHLLLLRKEVIAWLQEAGTPEPAVEVVEREVYERLADSGGSMNGYPALSLALGYGSVSKDHLQEILLFVMRGGRDPREADRPEKLWSAILDMEGEDMHPESLQALKEVSKTKKATALLTIAIFRDVFRGEQCKGWLEGQKRLVEEQSDSGTSPGPQEQRALGLSEQGSSEQAEQPTSSTTTGKEDAQEEDLAAQEDERRNAILDQLIAQDSAGAKESGDAAGELGSPILVDAGSVDRVGWEKARRGENAQAHAERLQTAGTFQWTDQPLSQQTLGDMLINDDGIPFRFPRNVVCKITLKPMGAKTKAHAFLVSLTQGPDFEPLGWKKYKFMQEVCIPRSLADLNEFFVYAVSVSSYGLDNGRVRDEDVRRVGSEVKAITAFQKAFLVWVRQLLPDRKGGLKATFEGHITTFAAVLQYLLHLWNSAWSQDGHVTLNSLKVLFATDVYKTYFDNQAKNPTGTGLATSMRFLGYSCPEPGCGAIGWCLEACPYCRRYPGPARKALGLANEGSGSGPSTLYEARYQWYKANVAGREKGFEKPKADFNRWNAEAGNDSRGPQSIEKSKASATDKALLTKDLYDYLANHQALISAPEPQDSA